MPASTRSSLKAAAPKAGRPKKAAEPLGGDEEKIAPVVLSAQVLRYLEYVQFEKRLAARTVTLYTLDLQRLTAMAAAVPVDLLELQSSHVRRFVAQMHSGGRSGRGIALILSGWRGFYVWATRQSLIGHNPVVGVRAPRAGKPLPKALGVDDAVQLANFTSTSHAPWVEARDAAMVELLYGCGLRIGELIGLDAAPHAATQRLGRGWVDMASCDVHVLGKGSKRRSLPLGAAAHSALLAWLPLRAAFLASLPESARRKATAKAEVAEQGSAGDALNALFISQRGTRMSAQSLWQRLRERSMQAGLNAPVHPHMLRHSFASHVLQSSGDLRGVQELLGHASITSTQVYTRLDFQHLAKVYDTAHPRAHLQKAPDESPQLMQADAPLPKKKAPTKPKP